MFKRISYKEKEKLIQSAINRAKPKLPKEDFTSSAPSPFVGRFGYPDVNLGILTTPEIKDDAWQYDAPKFWSKSNYQINQLVNLRTELINSKFKVNIKKIDNIISSVQEIALASKPVDVEIKTDKAPKILFKPDSFMAPTGAAAELKKFSITSNPKIKTAVQKVYYDTDLKAVDALTSLFNKGIDETALTRMLSVGSFGVHENRKLVPTRWSITATDDTLGKYLYKEIIDFQENSDFLIFRGDYLGNYYIILMFPGKWQYELFECYVGSKEFSTDFEPFQGRKEYAEECAGGYYTVKLAILEKLKEIKRQASVLVLRFISDEYLLPLGVWVTREASRKALNNEPLKFSDKELMLKYAKSLSQRKFSIDSNNFFKISKMLTQKSLLDFNK